jgi:ABC-2 type transport system permease protein
MNKVAIIIRKEWRDVFRDKMIFWTSLLLPLFFIAMPVGVVYFMERTPSGSANLNMPSGFEQLLLLPQFAGMDAMVIFERLMVEQFLLYFLMIPLMIPIFVAVYSIIGEKQQRSLEPLLATPISVGELLAGKTLAGVIPAVIITWISYILAALGLFIVARPEVANVALGATWILAMLILAPLLTIMAVLIGVIISSRVNDVRLAEQLGGMLVLPLVGLTIPVIMGKLLISAQMIGLIALGVAVLDAALLYVGVKLFQRETILIRWSR